MAIIPALPGIKVNICVNGIPLKEYEDDEEQNQQEDETGGFTKTIVKYIESVEGQEFSIQYNLGIPYKINCPNLLFNSSVDERHFDGVYVDRKIYNGQKTFTYLVKGVTAISHVTRKGVVLPFKFSRIETSMNDDLSSKLEDDAKRLENVGEIVIEIWRKSKGVLIPRSAGYKLDTEINSNPLTAVHEKALKGEPKYHGTGLGNGKRQRLPKVRRTKHLDKYPIAKYVFKYRSHEALQQLLILERTPEPEESSQPVVSSPALNALDTLNAQQKIKVEQYVQSLLGSSSGPSVKRERVDDEGPGPSRKKGKKSQQKITIDLTDD